MNPAGDQPVDGHAVDKDLLISRVVDGDAGEAEWAAFRAMADRDPMLWRELAEAQRVHADLTAAVEGALAIADGVEAPVHEHMARRLGERMRLAATWGGWLAAAALALAWAVGLPAEPAGPTPTGPGAQQAALPGLDSMSAAWQAYLDRGQEAGRVVGVGPNVLVQAQPAPRGEGYEVLYLRQVLERAVVPDLYQVGTDEWGRAVPVRAAAPVPVHGAM